MSPSSLQYVTVQFMWFTAHFLFWDYSQTLPPEEFSVDGVIRFLGSKDTAVYNQFAIWGTVRTPFIKIIQLKCSIVEIDKISFCFRQQPLPSYFSSRQWS